MLGTAGSEGLKVLHWCFGQAVNTLLLFMGLRTTLFVLQQIFQGNQNIPDALMLQVLSEAV